ncbi:Ras association domain-containing protein 2 [Frankliniella fusca]|uniref:Ras association domain-containing protein 2 n=1 Tax=Frankliniella fusca TaxID=407009 RepID=A0AAE1H6Y3_9NEOP|nr:Ras association domain-containing protein 2 [Frankliniella fusca]
MWKCHKCGKPVYFAERKQSLGYDWHPECLRCEECGKRLNPGQHAEHKGVPYCHVPCYGALFGPQLFGHGTRVESHTSFGKVENRTGIPNLPRSHLESKLKLFNQYYEGKSGKVHCREVNGRLVLEGALRIYWGVVGVIHLKEEYDQRTVVTVRKRNSYRYSNGINVNRYYNGKNKGAVSAGGSASCSSSSTSSPVSSPMSSPMSSPHVSPTHPSKAPPDSSQNTAMFECKSSTLPAKLDLKNIDWDELDDLLQVERQIEDGDKLYQTMPVGLHSVSSPEPFESSSSSTPRAPLTAQSSTESAELPFDNVDYNTAYFPEGSNSTSKATEKIDSPKNENKAVNQSDDDTDSYSKCFEDNVESDKRMSRSQSMPPDYNGDGDIWGDDDADDDESDMNDHPLDRSTSVPESNLSSSSSGLGGSDTQCRRKAAKTGSAAIRRRPGRRRSRTKLRRRCSINGHFYDRETSFFTPPHGSSTSVWVTSLVSTQEVVNLMLDKYRVDSKPDNFALFVVYDNGEQRRLREDEYPLVTRILLGPHEDVARIFIVDRHSTSEVSNEVAQFLNLSVAECSAILEGYQREEERQVQAVQSRYKELRKRIKQRMEELKVRL